MTLLTCYENPIIIDKIVDLHFGKYHEILKFDKRVAIRDSDLYPSVRDNGVFEMPPLRNRTGVLTIGCLPEPLPSKEEVENDHFGDKLESMAKDCVINWFISEVKETNNKG